tara:strand:+ start:69 stop:281 length:213 start_codon:yes stop_codon:yes gene_type:complete
MSNYTKEFWKEYDKKRSRANKGTHKFIEEMFNNPTQKSRGIDWDNYYMVTGFIRHDKDDFRRLNNLGNER